MAATLTSVQLATAKQVVGFLVAPGDGAFPLNSAIGFCGNIGQESGFNPTAVGDGGASKYLCQWQKDRRTGPDGIETWCKAQGLDVTTVDAQCKFIRWEFPKQVSATVASWIYDTSGPGGQPTRSIATLTADIQDYYERPGDPQLDNRIAYANQVAAALGVSPPPSPPPPVPLPLPAPSVSIADIIALITALAPLLGNPAANPQAITLVVNVITALLAKL